MFGWPRVRFIVIFSLAFGMVLSVGSPGALPITLARSLTLGMCLLVVFGLFERWPRRLTAWIARWALQVVAVGVTVPLATAAIFALTQPSDRTPFYRQRETMRAFSSMAGLALFVAPWTALAALVRQKETLAREQALAFELERSELERQALEARLGLLRAQVTPHFLFNTLANVQALVDSGSPVASAVLRSLTTYLRAAVPRIGERETTIKDETALVHAYLELMLMRMPDRLAFSVHVDETALTLRCPPMTLLTLVENAVRHSIDPSEEGGRIDVRVEMRGSRCHVTVRDTGVGLRPTAGDAGTGLSSLRERLRLAFGEDVHLHVTGATPGVSAEVDFPAEAAT